MTPLWPLCSVMLLTGCAADPIVTVQYVKQDIPASLLVCDGAPDVPGARATQRDVARFVVRLNDAGQDCRQKLDAVRGLVMATD